MLARNLSFLATGARALPQGQEAARGQSTMAPNAAAKRKRHPSQVGLSISPGPHGRHGISASQLLSPHRHSIHSQAHGSSASGGSETVGRARRESNNPLNLHLVPGDRLLAQLRARREDEAAEALGRRVGFGSAPSMFPVDPALAARLAEALEAPCTCTDAVSCRRCRKATGGNRALAPTLTLTPPVPPAPGNSDSIHKIVCFFSLSFVKICQILTTF